MKKNLLSLSVFLLSAAAGFSQAYNSPESIEFDAANNRWLIANTDAGNILARNSTTGAMSVFTALPSSPYGIEIVGTTLFVCDQSNHVKGYDLTSGAQTMNLTITGATFLNGITHDFSGNLFVTDFSAKRIYRINHITQQFNVFATGLAKSPNGIIHDPANNRCVFVTWGASAPIMAVSLIDSTVSTLTATSLSNIDGIAKDGAGNYYVASWGLNGISKFNNTFTGGPTTVVTGLSSPADIYYNTLTDTLGVPNSGAGNNTTYHYFGSATGITETVANSFKLSVNPNPVTKSAEINYVLATDEKVLIELFDIKGTLVRTIANESQAKGSYITFLSKNGLSAGTYILSLKTGTGTETKKIMISE